MLPAGAVLLAVLSALAVGRVDGGLQTCNVGAPDFQLCVRAAIQALIPQLARGEPNIGVLPVEPLRDLPPVKHSSYGLSVQLDNVVISGLSTATITDADVDLASNTIRVQSTVPGQITATGVHTTDAEIMGIPLKGSGPFTLTLVRPTLDLTLTGTPAVGPNGQTYLQLTSATARIDPGSPSADVNGFFSQFSPLERAANAFANIVAAPVIEDMRPSVEKWLEGIALERAQAIFSTVPYDVIFPGRTPAVIGLYRAFPTLPLASYRVHK